MIFWKWWTINILFIFGLFLSEFKFNAITYTIENDVSYLSLVIFVVYLITTIQIGIKSYKLQFRNVKFWDEENNLQWFLSDLVMSIGMVGTLLGFIMVLSSAFTDLDPSDTQAMKNVIGDVAQGMGVAILTTLTGLIASIFLKLELVILEKDNAEEI